MKALSLNEITEGYKALGGLGMGLGWELVPRIATTRLELKNVQLLTYTSREGKRAKDRVSYQCPTMYQSCPGNEGSLKFNNQFRVSM